jgi:hypothetical protein
MSAVNEPTTEVAHEDCWAVSPPFGRRQLLGAEPCGGNVCPDGRPSRCRDTLQTEFIKPRFGTRSSMAA